MLSANPDIQLQNVSKSFGSLRVLNDVSLAINKGETTIIMGPSGCGKSTLLRCLNGLAVVDSGKVLIEGNDITQPGTDLTALRSKVGMVFQQFNLFPHLTVLENITLAPTKVRGISEKDAQETAMSLLTRIGIPDKANAWPDQLSGGQKQRVAIARCLAMQPSILLLDEPTSALDPLMASEVMDLVKKLADEGLTIVLVSHNIRFAERAGHKLVFLEEGKIVEEGPPKQLLQSASSPQVQKYLAALG